jgi:hypothetical protein
MHCRDPGGQHHQDAAQERVAMGALALDNHVVAAPQPGGVGFLVMVVVAVADADADAAAADVREDEKTLGDETAAVVAHAPESDAGSRMRGQLGADRGTPNDVAVVVASNGACADVVAVAVATEAVHLPHPDHYYCCYCCCSQLPALPWPAPTWHRHWSTLF